MLTMHHLLLMLIIMAASAAVECHETTTSYYDTTIFPDDYGPGCWSNGVNIEKYPFLVTVFLDCDDYHYLRRSSAAIISADYILGMSVNPGAKCNYTVRVAADERGENGTWHAVEEFIEQEVPSDDWHRIYQLSLYKLARPIEFGPRAQSIKILEQSPKTGVAAIATGFEEENDWVNIYEKNRTVTTEKDLRAFYDELPEGAQRPLPVGILATLFPYDTCTRTWSSVLVVDDKLAGLMFYPDSIYVNDGHSEYDGYIDVAYYKDWIRNNTGIL